MLDLDFALRWMQPRLAEYLQDLRALVEVDCGTDDKEGVDRAAGLFLAMVQRYALRQAQPSVIASAAKQSPLQFEGPALERFPLSSYGDCHLVTWRGKGALRLLLSGHLDTVYPRGTVASRPLTQEGNRLLGPGVCDMKAGLLSGLYAVRLLQAAGFDDFAQIQLFLSPDEEMDSPESKKIYQPLAAQVDAALVLESARANGDIVSARKGNANYWARVHGRQAHAGVEIEKGANAILELAHFIQRVTALNQMHPGTTVNVGVIGGGTRPNVVPDLAWAEVDARVLTYQAGQALDQAVRAIAATPQVPGTWIELEGGVSKGPMEKTAATSLLVELAHRVGDRLGLAFNDVLSGGTSDGNYIGELGVPTLDGLGPVGGRDHSPEEYLEADSIVPRTVFLAGLIAAMAGQREEIRARRGR